MKIAIVDDNKEFLLIIKNIFLIFYQASTNINIKYIFNINNIIFDFIEIVFVYELFNLFKVNKLNA